MTAPDSPVFTKAPFPNPCAGLLVHGCSVPYIQPVAPDFPALPSFLTLLSLSRSRQLPVLIPPSPSSTAARGAATPAVSRRRTSSSSPSRIPSFAKSPVPSAIASPSSLHRSPILTPTAPHSHLSRTSPAAGKRPLACDPTRRRIQFSCRVNLASGECH